MAKITITIEDVGDRVKTVVTPSCETLIQKHASGHTLTSAEAYTLFCMRQLREEAKRQSPTRILIPRIGRR